MNTSLKTTVWASMGLGIAGNALLREAPWGLNASLWIVGLAVATWLVTRASRREMTLTMPPVVFFAACLAWRDSDALRLWNLLAIIVGLTLPIMQSRGISVRSASIPDYLSGLRRLAGNLSLGGFRLLGGETPIVNLENGDTQARLRSVGVGLLVAAPLVAVFTGLFASADASFEHLVSVLLRPDIEELLFHLGFVGLFTAMAAGYLREFLLPQRSDAAAPGGKPARMAEVLIPLGSMLILFVTFGVLQLRYLFGGADFVSRTAGLTFAQYARGGFFQLVIATALVIPILAVLQARVDSGDRNFVRAFRSMATGQLAFVVILIASVLHRLALYVDSYGLTESRIIAVAVTVWIGIAMTWFVLTALKGRPQRFATGAVVAGLALLASLNLLNPQALVVRTNIRRAAAGAEFDHYYLYRLDSDAVPALVDGLGEFSQELQCEVAGHLESRLGGLGWKDWRTWTVSDWRAKRKLTRAEPRLSYWCSTSRWAGMVR